MQNVTFYIFCVIIIFCNSACQNSIVEEGQTAPDFQINSLTNESYALRDFYGKPIYLNFWTVTCKPCLEDFYEFRALMNDLATNQKVHILNICMDADAARIVKYLKRYELAIPNIYTVNDIDELIHKYDIGAFPHHVVIDDSGKVIANNAQGMFANLK